MEALIKFWKILFWLVVAAVFVIALVFLLGSSLFQPQEYTGQAIHTNHLYSLKLSENRTCFISPEERTDPPASLKEIAQERRNIEILQESPNIGKEEYELTDVDGFVGTTQATVVFYRRRLLKIEVFGRNESEIIFQHFYFDAMSRLMGSMDRRIIPKPLDEKPGLLAPESQIYRIIENQYHITYDCTLQQRRAVLDTSDENYLEMRPKDNAFEVIESADVDATEILDNQLRIKNALKEIRKTRLAASMFEDAGLSAALDPQQAETASDKPQATPPMDPTLEPAKPKGSPDPK
ncbi:MAG: hypothetical protein VYA34_08575 [Myxococcota bacterium]|nr:hypothetical protein [Myxococcota bacterium]